MGGHGPHFGRTKKFVKQAGFLVRGVLGLIFVALWMSATQVAFAQPQPGAPQNTQTLESKEDLAKQYIVIAHRIDRLRITYGKQLRLYWTICDGKTCQPDLDRAVDGAVSDMADNYQQRLVKILSQRLTAENLRAAIDFAKSPQGQEITRAEDGMTDELALMGHTMSLAARDEVSRRFCPKHPDICTAGGGVPTRVEKSQPPR